MRLFSTRDSIRDSVPASTAIIETGFAVIAYWWIAVRFETYLPLLLGACVAPLVLLRSEESVALGKRCFLHWENDSDRAQLASWEDTILYWAARALRRLSDAARSISGRALISSIVVFLLARQFLTGIEGWKLFLGSAVLAWISVALTTGIVSLLAASSRMIVFDEQDLVTIRGTQLAEAAGAVTGIAVASLPTMEYLIPTGGAAGAAFALLGGWPVRSALGGRALIGALFLSSFAILAAIPVSGRWGIFAGVLTCGPTVYGSAAGVLLVSLAIRFWAVLHYPLKGLKALPDNFYRLCLCTGPLQPPELIPGLAKGESKFTIQSFWSELCKRKTLLGFAISLVLLIVWFGPGWVYRFALKSTFWVWWPLAFIADSPKLAKTPAWQYKMMVRGFFAWIAIAIASYTEAAFLLTNFVSTSWHKGMQNPFLTPLGYLFVLGWSGKFWPIFAIVGPTLSLGTLCWLQRNFAKYETARQNNYEALKREAERTFPIIERVQRFQRVLLIVYCILVVAQAALYFNSQECWIRIAPNVQSWSDWFFGAKSPHQGCDFP